MLKRTNLALPARAADAADLANEEIRAFMRARLGRSLWPDEAQEYAVLLERWQRAASSLRPAG
jgi:hypothetical protein